jgi:hypothetical protein
MTEEVKVVKVFESFILGFCKCGCGDELKSIRDRCRQALKFYLPHHHRRPKLSKLDYKRVYIPDHPYADSKGCVKYHRFVMEQILGRYLEPWEVVDHINKDRQDNRPENLRLFSSQSNHMQNHKPKTDMSDRLCSDPNCLYPINDKIKRANGQPSWYNDGKGGHVCFICWRRELRKNGKISW